MLRESTKKSISPVISSRCLLLLLSFLFFFTGCASSEVARSSASGVDKTVQGSRDLYNSATSDGDIATSYQNTSQTTKGALIGGSVGVVAGAMSSKLGMLPGAALGAVIGAGFGAYIDAHTTLEDRLENRGVSVVTLGDQVLIVIASSRLFPPASAELKPQAYSTLDMVAQYINRYDKTLVRISAYTNPIGPSDVNTALSREQAHSVEKYLLETGMDARVIYAEGYGGTHLVENCSDTCSETWDSSDNYRIEITMEKLDV